MTAATPLGRKADHVRQAKSDGRHTCHWPGCAALVPPAMWGCRKHWYALPLALRTKIWRAYRPGQEIDKQPSASYLEVAHEVQRWIAAKVQSP